MKKTNKRQKLEKIILAVLAAAAIMAAIAAFCMTHIWHSREEPATGHGGLVLDIRATDAQAEKPGPDPLAGRSVFFSGIEDAAISRGTVVQLDNREENLDFLLRYEIYDADGELVFETGLIPSGQHIDWVPGETLEAGEHSLNFLQIPYYVNPSGEYVSLTQGSCQVTLAILD